MPELVVQVDVLPNEAQPKLSLEYGGLARGGAARAV